MVHEKVTLSEGKSSLLLRVICYSETDDLQRQAELPCWRNKSTNSDKSRIKIA